MRTAAPTNNPPSASVRRPVAHNEPRAAYGEAAPARVRLNFGAGVSTLVVDGASGRAPKSQLHALLARLERPHHSLTERDIEDLLDALEHMRERPTSVGDAEFRRLIAAASNAAAELAQDQSWGAAETLAILSLQAASKRGGQAFVDAAESILVAVTPKHSIQDVVAASKLVGGAACVALIGLGLASVGPLGWVFAATGAGTGHGALWRARAHLAHPRHVCAPGFCVTTPRG